MSVKCIMAMAINSTVFAIVFGAVIALWGNYRIQKKMQTNMQLFHNVDNIKQRLYEFVDISTKYWTLDGDRREIHSTLEAKIIAKKYEIQTEYSGGASRFRQVNKSYQETVDCRISLWTVSTGGCFQQSQWNPEPERIRRITSEASCIVRSLYQLT